MDSNALPIAESRDVEPVLPVDLTFSKGRKSESASFYESRQPGAPGRGRGRNSAESRERVRMRGFPFGALSSSESNEFRWTMWPCAEREAPYANSLSRLTIVCEINFSL